MRTCRCCAKVEQNDRERRLQRSEASMFSSVTRTSVALSRTDIRAYTGPALIIFERASDRERDIMPLQFDACTWARGLNERQYIAPYVASKVFPMLVYCMRVRTRRKIARANHAFSSCAIDRSVAPTSMAAPAAPLAPAL